MKDKLHAALKALGVETLTCEYSGYGDSGSMEKIQTIPDVSLSKTFDIQEGWNNKERPRSLSAAIHDYFYEILSFHHGGWDNGDGSQGDFTWNIETNELTLDHGENYTTTEHHNYAF